MRTIIYVVILSMLFFVPLEPVEIARLLPIETVAVYMNDGDVVLETDTEHKGRGDTVMTALGDLKENTAAVVYLDTAKYLLIAKNALDYVDQLRQYLKPNVEVAMWDGSVSIKDAARYFDVHGNTVPLKQLQKEKKDEKSEKKP